MTKIIYPNKGTIETYGKLTSLLELGAGFHPDFSGRENIYFNASIFGLTRKQIDERLEDIIEFSELREFIDNPVRTYSSGMFMRLAFAVAINVDADILLIDEILSVGDEHFQKKCFDKMKDLKKQGKTTRKLNVFVVRVSKGKFVPLVIREGSETQLKGCPTALFPISVRTEIGCPRGTSAFSPHSELKK